MPATLKSLAAELGVTPAAVSMALRNHPRISLAMRKKARALAKKRGYVPNPAYSRAGGWRKRQAPAGMPLAVVEQRHPLEGFGVSTSAAALKQVAETFGYAPQFHECPTGQAARLSAILYARGVEAVVIGRIFDSQFIEDFAWHQFCVVALDAGYYRAPCHLVMPDVAEATFDAVRRALAMGFRRIGLYDFKEIVEPVDWADRFGAAAAAREICESQKARFDHGCGGPYDMAAFARWVEKVRPDIVLGQTPSCFWWLREMAGAGVALPFISLHLDPSENSPELAGYIHDNESLASVAIKLLDSEVRNFERGKPPIPTRQLVSMPWHPGTSAERPTGQRAQASSRTMSARAGSRRR